MVARGADGRSEPDGRESQDREEPHFRNPREGGEGRSPFAPLMRDLGALQAYIAHYLAAQSNAVSARVKRAVMWTALGLGGLVAGLTMIVITVSLALFGIADGIAVALGSRWLGELITGVGILVLLGLAAWIGIRYWLNLSLRKAKENYERRRIKERVNFGQDVAQRAAS